MQCPDHKSLGVGADVYGVPRLALANLVKPLLHEANLTWFLDAGTLLGAHRSGTQIAHDDDFDIAIYVPSFRDAELVDLGATLTAALPAPFACRVVTSYAHKVEVYDSTSRTFVLPPRYGGADFHTVTVDLQVMTDAPGGVTYLHEFLSKVRIPEDAITPTGEIMLEGHTFNSPHAIVCFLEAQYGYIGTDATFDASTGKYIKTLPRLSH